MPYAHADTHSQSQNASAKKPDAEKEKEKEGIVRLHITPFTPALLKVYLAPSVLPLAKNISYHTVETFPEKGFGYVDLPVMEAQKLKKKLNGSTLKGSKVRIEEAKPEKRKALREADAAAEAEEKPAKRAKREKKKKENGVLEGVELPEGRKVKRGWTETPAEKKKAKMEKKDKKDKKEKKEKAARKESKYTKEPELLFNAKLTPVAANELLRKEKKAGKKDKKKKNAREVVIHEFEHNTKTPTFLKAPKIATETKPAVEYINGKGWVDEDGNVVEAETGKARNRRLLELVDPIAPKPSIEKSFSRSPEAESTPKSKSKEAKKDKKKEEATPPPSSSESEAEESSVVSSSSADESSASESDSDAESSASEAAAPKPSASPAAEDSRSTPQMVLTPSSPTNKAEQQSKEVHPLEALFKRPKPPALLTPSSAAAASSAPAKGLPPINTDFSFFGDNADADTDAGAMDTSTNEPLTPFTQKDLEWRGLRSAAPTPDTAAIGRRFSFDWRKGSHEKDEEDEDEDMSDAEAGKQLSNNTKANTNLPDVAEEDNEASDGGDDSDADADADATPSAKGKRGAGSKEPEDEKEESEFGKWFWENRGDNNRAWKKRRRDTMKAKRLRENRKITGGRKVV